LTNIKFCKPDKLENVPAPQLPQIEEFMAPEYPFSLKIDLHSKEYILT